MDAKGHGSCSGNQPSVHHTSSVNDACNRISIGGFHRKGKGMSFIQQASRNAGNSHHFEQVLYRSSIPEKKSQFSFWLRRFYPWRITREGLDTLVNSKPVGGEIKIRFFLSTNIAKALGIAFEMGHGSQSCSGIALCHNCPRGVKIKKIQRWLLSGMAQTRLPISWSQEAVPLFPRYSKRLQLLSSQSGYFSRRNLLRIYPMSGPTLETSRPMFSVLCHKSTSGPAETVFLSVQVPKGC